MSCLSYFYFILITVFIAISPSLGPTLIKHGFEQEIILLLLGVCCGILLKHLTSGQVGGIRS